ncbi:MAG: hypothetical protein ACREKL_13880 [Chthoniobacterales bacterium]
MRLFAEIWNLYLGLLTLLGNAVLVLIGLGLCGYTTYQQMQPLHDTAQDVMIFVGGLLLISFSMVRRMIWSFCGLVAVWGGVIWAGMHVFMSGNEEIKFTPELIAIAVIPPFFMTLYLESVRKNTSDLEISLSKKPGSDD